MYVDLYMAFAFIQFPTLKTIATYWQLNRKDPGSS